MQPYERIFKKPKHTSHSYRRKHKQRLQLLAKRQLQKIVKSVLTKVRNELKRSKTT